jgi:CheY-like chemotaxis protein
MEAKTLQASEDTLLIVDDEPLMTELFEKFMSKRGFRVLTAASGPEALRIIEHEKDNIRLVLTDMTMPVMDGLALARELLKFVPSVPVMLATGHDADLETAGGLPNVISVVRKPYQNRDLAEQIRELLDSHQPGRL